MGDINNNTSETGIQSQGKKASIRNNPISKYNYFVVCYNTEYHVVEGKYMTKLKRNKFYEFLYPFLYIKYTPLLWLLYILPYFNVISSFVMISLWIIYECQYRIVKRNAAEVPTPFTNMIYFPDLCTRM